MHSHQASLAILLLHSIFSLKGRIGYIRNPFIDYLLVLGVLLKAHIVAWFINLFSFDR